MVDLTTFDGSRICELKDCYSECSLTKLWAKLADEADLDLKVGIVLDHYKSRNYEKKIMLGTSDSVLY